MLEGITVLAQNEVTQYQVTINEEVSMTEFYEKI